MPILPAVYWVHQKHLILDIKEYLLACFRCMKSVFVLRLLYLGKCDLQKLWLTTHSFYKLKETNHMYLLEIPQLLLWNSAWICDFAFVSGCFFTVIAYVLFRPNLQMKSNLSIIMAPNIRRKNLLQRPAKSQSLEHILQKFG